MRFLALFLLFFIATPAFANVSFDWKYTNGNVASTFLITQNNIQTTGGAYTHLCSVINKNLPASQLANLTFVQRLSGTTNFNIPSLNQGNYLIVKGSLSNFNTSPCRTQAIQTGNINSTYPLGTEQMGFIYFEVTASNKIHCYSFQRGFISNSGGLNTFQACERDLSVWGYQNGFFGNTKPLDVSASVIEGVQDTGTNLWPLLIFLGVSIAFIIFIQVVALTKHTTRISETKKAKRRKRPY